MPAWRRIFRRRAQDGDVAPVEPGRDHQPVEAVRFGVARDDGVEGVFEPGLDFGQIGGAAIGAFHLEIEHGGVALSSRRRSERDRIGILGDDLEAEIFEHRQAGRKRQHRAHDIELEAQRAMGVARRRDRRGHGWASPFASADRFDQFVEIAHRLFGLEGVAIARREGVAMLRRTGARLRPRHGRSISASAKPSSQVRMAARISASSTWTSTCGRVRRRCGR